MNKKIRKIFLLSICLSIIIETILPTMSTTKDLYASSVDYTTSNSTIINFTDSGASASGKYSGYAITENDVEISSSGVYVFTGTCSDGTITVNKGVSDVVLILKDLDLTSSTSAPIVIKKSSNVTLHLEGTSTLTDSESDETLDTYEGAAIKVKSGSTLTFCGDGELNINGNSKNGIKGGETSSLIFNDGTYNVNAVNNAIASDGSIVINNGTYNIVSQDDGIKSVPESTDTESVGSITINNGNITIDANSDAIVAETLVQINNGTIDIKTENGYDSTTFTKDTMSAKGIKASGDREDIENNINITGGTITLNTADDAIHSDTNVTLTGGTYYIYTGDDGAHADTLLVLGSENGYERDPEIYIYSSYEGLEAGTIYGYSGKYNVIATDDGMNAAGGSDNSGAEPGGGGFNPGGRPQKQGNQSSSTDDYAMYFYGGDYYINCDGDGIDSNGALYFYGGNFTVLSQARGGDNSPYDSDGSWVIDGATLFGAGTNPMRESPSSNSQKYSTTTSQYSANTIIDVKNGQTTLYSEELPKTVNYIIYSSPDVTSATFSSASSLDTCKSNAWAHTYDDGVTSDGVTTYICTSCSKTERKTALTSVSSSCDGHIDESDDGEEVKYTVTFVIGDGATVDTYYTQDYTQASEENVTVAYARNSDTGDILSDGNGQVNFKVNLEDGYTLDSVTADANYKNLKDQGDGIYRITKITGDVTVTITTEKETTTTTRIKGDLNNDNLVNSTDASIALDLYKNSNATDEEIKVGDMNGDNIINSTDASMILDVYKYNTVEYVTI